MYPGTPVTQKVSTLDDPPSGVVDIDSNLDVVFDPCLRGFTVGVTGNVSVTYDDGSQAVLPARQAGVDYRGMIKTVSTSGTTATGIFGYR